MSLRSLVLVRIKEHREIGNEERAHRLEDALAYIDGARPCTIGRQKARRAVGTRRAVLRRWRQAIILSNLF